MADFADQIADQIAPVVVRRVVIRCEQLSNGRVIIDATGEDPENERNGWTVSGNLTPAILDVLVEQFSG